MNCFKQAIKDMYDAGEFEKIIKHAPRLERKKAKQFYEMLQTNEKSFGSIEKIPLIPLIHSCNSAEIWKDAFYFIIRNYPDCGEKTESEEK